MPETYVHRIGRTGRAGREGKAISLCAADENGDLANIEKLINNYITVVRTPKEFFKKPDLNNNSKNNKGFKPKKDFSKPKNTKPKRRK